MCSIGVHPQIGILAADQIVSLETVPDRLLLTEPEGEAEAIREESRAVLAAVLAELPTREEKVLRMRFGLNDDGPMTMDEIGYDFALCRERVRQIESQGMRHLRGRIGKLDKPRRELLESYALGEGG